MAYKTISVAGHLLGPGKTALVPKSSWTSTDDLWVQRGVITIAGKEGDNLYIRSNVVDRSVQVASPPPAEEEEKPVRVKRKYKRSSGE